MFVLLNNKNTTYELTRYAVRIIVFYAVKVYIKMHMIADDYVHAWWLIMGWVIGLISGRNKSILQVVLEITWPLYHWLPRAFYLGIKWLQLVADHSPSPSAELRNCENLPSISRRIHGLEYGIDNQFVPQQLGNIPSL